MGGMKRREFCKTAPCAAVGAAWSAGDEGKKVVAVEAKVLSQKGSCAMGHKVGDVTKFTESEVEGKICIHALYSMMPAVFAMMFESKFTWLDDPDTKTHACPDAYNPVVFEITRLRK
jgi:uncharacterized repeat protein (TIGR04076 family)